MEPSTGYTFFFLLMIYLRVPRVWLAGNVSQDISLNNGFVSVVTLYSALWPG